MIHEIGHVNIFGGSQKVIWTLQLFWCKLVYMQWVKLYVFTFILPSHLIRRY